MPDGLRKLLVRCLLSNMDPADIAEAIGERGYMVEPYLERLPGIREVERLLDDEEYVAAEVELEKLTKKYGDGIPDLLRVQNALAVARFSGA